ncbi:sigma-E processing peptidase SpoIIGA [uncultured Subdoligranulum sp.]|uniref:sigma-E processing peptidase SpoIIGA n=1 Tax=uncultured Subdoligranulum sp. TaxID=512298 RepID=UPI0026023A51|nr:sigma-E processing peptidase SpoIIGA [uncultured Subdoligranulum sp.]
MKTVIYLDVLLLVNFLAAYFLLLAAGLLGGQRAGFVRMLFGSGAAALSSLILFAPEQPYPVQLAYKIGTALIISAIAFGWKNKRRLFTIACWYAALNIALAGAVLLVILRTGTRMLQTGNLAVYLRISPLLLVVLSGICCLAVEGGTRFFTKRKPASETVGLELELGNLTIHLRAALDTGCHLTDPITCLPVLVVSFPDAKDRLPPSVRNYLSAWFAGQAPGEPPQGTKLRLIPCDTAADRSLLPGFAVNNIGLITPNGILELGRSAVAFAPQSFGSACYEALYGNEFL